MKDLRFKIIAELVREGFARAESIIDNLRSRFATFFDGARSGWLKMGATIAAVGVAAYRVFEGIRQKWLEEIHGMTADSVKFAQDVATNLRNIKFQDTDIERSRNLESLKEQIQAKRMELEKLDDDNATESVASKGIDLVQAGWRGAMGMGFKDADDARAEKLRQEIHVLERQRALAASTPTKDEANARKDARKSTGEAEKEWKAEEDAARAARLAADKVVHETELAWAREEGEAWKAAMDKKVEAALEAQRKHDRIAELTEGVNTARRESAYSNATPEQQRKMDEARLNELRKQVMAKNDLGDFVLPPEKRAQLMTEGIKLKAEIDRPVEKEAEKEAEKEKTKKGVWQQIGIGDAFEKLYGQRGAQDPGERTAKATEETVKLLGKIEKKLGAAP